MADGASFALTPFAEVADFTNGYAFGPADWGKSGLPIIRIQQLLNPAAEADSCEAMIGDRYLIDTGDLVMSWSGTIAVVRWDRGPAWLNQHLFRVDPKPGVDEAFLKHLLDSSLVGLEAAAHGTTMKHIKRGDLLRHDVLLPPKEEQRRIAEILDTIDETIQATERVIAKLRATTDGLRNALIGEQGTLRGWERLDRMIRVIDCKHYTPRYAAAGYPVVRPRNVKPGRLDFGDIEFVGEAEFAILTDSHRPGRGDIVLSRNASFGAAALVDFDQPFAIGQDVVVLSPTAANSKYIEACLRSDHVQRQIAAVSGGSTFGRINLGDIRQLRIPGALANAQEEIAGTLTAAEQAVSTEQVLMNKLKKQRAGLAEDLLSGRVRTVAA